MRMRSPSRCLGATLLLACLVLLTTGAGLAAVLAAPTAITGPVSAVGPTSATASGTVNPNGQSTSWHFEYGTSTTYGKKTSSRSAGSGTANVQVSGALTALSPSTTYHYRLVAANGGGTTRGGDGIFTTPSAAECDHRLFDERHRQLGDAQRNGRPERPGDDLVLPVRHQHGLRLENARAERRLGHDGGGRRGRGFAPEAGTALPLSARRDERRRHEPRRGPHVLDLRSTNGGHGACVSAHA